MALDYFKYVDFPQIPKELIEFDLCAIESKKNNFKNVNYPYYKKYYVNPDLNDFLKSKIDVPFIASYQVIRSGLDIHRDVGRIECYNYILDTGGDDTRLVIYDDDAKSVLLDEYIEPFKWHWIFVKKFHNVVSIERPRIAITLSVREEYSLKKYSGLI